MQSKLKGLQHPDISLWYVRGGIVYCQTIAIAYMTIHEILYVDDRTCSIRQFILFFKLFDLSLKLGNFGISCNSGLRFVFSSFIGSCCFLFSGINFLFSGINFLFSGINFCLAASTSCLAALTSCLAASTSCLAASASCLAASASCLAAFTSCLAASTSCLVIFNSCLAAVTSFLVVFNSCFTAFTSILAFSSCALTCQPSVRQYYYPISLMLQKTC